MMERERRDRERQEAFEATWRSYRQAMDDAFALQNEMLRFTRGLLEAPAETLRAQTESNQAALDSLAEQSRRQQETLQRLVRESTNAYLNLLQLPFSYYQEVVEAMTAPLARTPGGSAPGGDDLPLAGYDSMNVREIGGKLDGLSTEELRRLRDHEVRNKNRQTLVRRFEEEIEANSP